MQMVVQMQPGAGYRKRSTNSNRNARRYYGLLLYGANPATLVVNVAVGPFTYALDGNAAISSASTTFSFANVTPGTHTILVTTKLYIHYSEHRYSTCSSIQRFIARLTCLVDALLGTQ
jgi:hypothetical protein